MYPLIPIGNGLFLPSYFLFIALCFSIGTLYAVRESSRYDLSPITTLDLSLVLMISGFLGSRVFHIIYEYPSLYINDPWQAFRVWEGGFVFYGGFITAILAGSLFVKMKKESPLDYLDIFAPILPLCNAIGRFATLLSGSGYGRPTSLPWAITYPPGTEAPSGIPLHPTPLYAMALSLSEWLVILYLIKKRDKLPFLYSRGQLFLVSLALHGTGRLIVEQFRDDYRGHTYAYLSISSWISLGLVITAMICFLLQSLYRPPHPP